MMDDPRWLVQRFEEHRRHLHGVAYRMLGSESDADDALQEAWLRVSRSDARDVDNIGGWLTTVVARIALDMLRTRKSRREAPIEDWSAGIETDVPGPEREALIADAVGTALMVVLDRLNPAERVAFVLHDLFDIPFEQIAAVLGKSAVAVRQLASRALLQTLMIR
jgi:RNA polymerase sigma-70 factor (ECF subfamily)